MSAQFADEIERIIGEILPEVVETRHHLHRHPELSGQEQETSALVAERLRRLGIEEVRTQVGGYGVVATLRGGAGAGPMFAIRADMDALPIHEQNDVPYRSCRDGVMHACGHDGHTSTLLGTAAVLARLRDRLPGAVRFIFQPAEETVNGARGMCEAGAMEGVQAVLALHGWPGLEVGRIGVRTGPMMASSDTFHVVVKGRGGHAAMPHVTVDPIVTGAQIVMALQTLASREISPVEPVVVTVAQFHAGTAENIIAGEARVSGTVRCLRQDVQKAMPERLERVIGGVCAAMRAEYTFDYRNGTPVTVNDGAVNGLIAQVARDALGPEAVLVLDAPSMGAEDFAMYLQHAPGAMFRLGVGAEMSPLHTPRYNFADEALPVGIRVFARAAVTYLSQGGLDAAARAG